MLETTRLKLVPLTHEQLLLYKNNPKALAENLNTRYVERQHDPLVMADVEEAIEFWIKNTWEHKDAFEWFTNWEIILKAENVGVGGIGFSGMPDGEGKTMVGYGLDVRYHGRGIAAEALTVITQWAFLDERLKTIVADTPMHNVPSQRVLQKNGFHETFRNEKVIHWQLKHI
jgi:[ribosomal protein S5]-alanine N-acetyltransferase